MVSLVLALVTLASPAAGSAAPRAAGVYLSLATERAVRCGDPLRVDAVIESHHISAAVKIPLAVATPRSWYLSATSTQAGGPGFRCDDIELTDPAPPVALTLEPAGRLTLHFTCRRLVEDRATQVRALPPGHYHLELRHQYDGPPVPGQNPERIWSVAMSSPPVELEVTGSFAVPASASLGTSGTIVGRAVRLEQPGFQGYLLEQGIVHAGPDPVGYNVGVELVVEPGERSLDLLDVAVFLREGEAPPARVRGVLVHPKGETWLRPIAGPASARIKLQNGVPGAELRVGAKYSLLVRLIDTDRKVTWLATRPEAYAIRPPERGAIPVP